MQKFKIIILSLSMLTACESKNAATHEPHDTSHQLFLELWEKFDQNYAFFELRNVDWEQEKKAFTASLSEVHDDTLLFNRFCELLKKFDDTHINLESDRLELYCNSGKTPNFLKEFPSNESFGVFLEARDETLRKIGITTIQESTTKLFQYGRSADKAWGYLRIKRFYGTSLDKIRADLNTIMLELASPKHLIIDIRINPGGNDETALLCASYFFKEQEIAFIKRVRKGPGYEDFSEPDTTFIHPHQEIQTKPEQIYLLTNGASGSSADAFALVMSYLPHLKIVGTNTEGIFSNMYRDTLANGWRLSLSNERYFSKDMKCYEKIGVPVDMEVENTFKDAKKGVDNVIESIISRSE